MSGLSSEIGGSSILTSSRSTGTDRGPKRARGMKLFLWRSRKLKVIDPANAGGTLDDGVQNRLHVRRRAADDAENLGRRGLMLESLSQFRIALLESLKQPDVLYGNKPSGSAERF